MEEGLSVYHPLPNLWMHVPQHHRLYKDTWVEDVATELCAFEMWERMTDGGAKIVIPHSYWQEDGWVAGHVLLCNREAR